MPILKVPLCLVEHALMLDSITSSIKIKSLNIFSEPLNKNTLADPKKIWPITISQNIFLKKVN